jgi:hypothetical protein
MHQAVATSIVSVIATSTAVASTNVERGTAKMRLGMTLEMATALGAIVGGLTAGEQHPRVLEGLLCRRPHADGPLCRRRPGRPRAARPQLVTGCGLSCPASS